jgi:hypothetical protein
LLALSPWYNFKVYTQEYFAPLTTKTFIPVDFLRVREYISAVCLKGGEKMKKVLLVVLGIIVILFIIGAASGGSNTGTQKVGNNTNVSPTAAPQGTVYKVGDQVKSGDFVFSVNSVSKDEGTAYVKPAAGSIYVIPNVTIQNNGKTKSTVSTLLQMYIKDSEGNKYTPALTQNATGKVDGELLAGDKVKGDVGFEVPTSATGLKFYFTPEWLTGTTIVVDLGL